MLLFRTMNRTNKSRPLPADWREQVLDYLNDDLATWVIAEKDENGKSVKPEYVELFDDYAVPVMLVEGGEHLADYYVTKNEVCGFAFFHQILL